MVAGPLILEPNAPPWAHRFVLALKGFFAPLVPAGPTQLASYPSAALPDPADYRGCIIYVTDKAKVARSNGTAWTDAVGGVL